MEEAPENGKESSNSAHASEMEWLILVGRDSAVVIATRYGLDGP
jgi:hypothetical protein